MSDRISTSPSAVGPGLLSRTVGLLTLAAGRRYSRFVFVVAGMGYLLLYLATVGDLSLFDGGTGPLTVRTASDISRGLGSVGFFRFAAVALVSVGGFT